MDHSYKQAAYMSLSEGDKQELLSNAQLKDEKTLQDAGVRNLQLRLTEQQKGTFKIQSELLDLKRQVIYDSTCGYIPFADARYVL
jgi:hypothetical protein